MTTNDEVLDLCKKARQAGAHVTLTYEGGASPDDPGAIVETVTVRSEIPRLGGPHPMSPIAAAEHLRDAWAKGLLAPVIVSAEITPMPRPMPLGMSDPLPKVHVTLADGQSQDLFCFYPDEISFQPADFVGLTVAAAKQLRFQRDTAYLKSDADPAPGGSCPRPCRER